MEVCNGTENLAYDHVCVTWSNWSYDKLIYDSAWFVHVIIFEMYENRTRRDWLFEIIAVLNSESNGWLNESNLNCELKCGMQVSMNDFNYIGEFLDFLFLFLIGAAIVKAECHDQQLIL